ncbi:MAG: Hsp20/alpha crystallin family protein [Ignavibacteriae bacterium]|nr:Hsp20/alpha crystallin family protein [Ignavibacteriota bacterium]
MSSNNDVAVMQQDNTALRRQAEQIATVAPLTDIFETADAYVLKLDMPGASKESINVTMDKDSLVIRGEAQNIFNQSAKVLYSEIQGAVYHRNFNITESVDRNSVDAQFEDGVLTLKLLKKEELKAREIQIK